MGHKTHPLGFRLGIIKDWKTHWYADNARAYRTLILEDLELRKTVKREYSGFSDAGIARVEIDRGAQDSVINIHSARPGILIGRDGERVKNLRAKLVTVILPRLLRPACFCKGDNRDFSGFFRVISSKEGRTAFLCPGVFGFRFFNGITDIL